MHNKKHIIYNFSEVSKMCILLIAFYIAKFRLYVCIMDIEKKEEKKIDDEMHLCPSIYFR